MNPKNIQEYIVQGIIKHNKYRDDEIDELKKALDDMGISKCGICLKYSKEYNVCSGCEFACCDSCLETKLKRINNSCSYPTYLCDECSKIYCNHCMVTDIKKCDKCAEREDALCEYCHERWPEWCL